MFLNHNKGPYSASFCIADSQRLNFINPVTFYSHLFGYSDMSDSESVISSVFENDLSMNDPSDTETIEPNERIQRNRLTVYEYVSVTINIEATLARDFQRHSLRNNGVGKIFRLDSEDAVRRMFGLIHEFLETYDIPTSRRIQRNSDSQSTQYPFFIPSRRIMLIFRRLPFSQYEFLPVRVLRNPSSSLQYPELERLLFAALNPPVSSRRNYHRVLRSNPPFFIEHGLFQQMDSSCNFTVATVKDGPTTLLEPGSIQLIEQIHPFAQSIAVRIAMARYENPPKQSQGLSSGERERRDSQRSMSSLTIGDVMVDVDRTIGTSSSIGLNINEEIERVLQIAEYFIRWCLKE